MFLKLALLFVGVPLLELALLVWAGTRLGFWPTMALVLLTGLVGAMLARSAGLRVVMQIRSELQAGRMPMEHMIDGLLVLVGGAVLLTPGLLTDLLGFALLVPGSRRLVKGFVQRRIRSAVETRRIQIIGLAGRPVGEDDIRQHRG